MGDVAGAACVSDSEAEESEAVIWKPDWQETPLKEQLSVVNISREHEKGIKERREIATQRFRSFRKRTAVQKNPYKLDRIRHKQLLRGFELPKELADRTKDGKQDDWKDLEGSSSQDAEWKEDIGPPRVPEVEDSNFNVHQTQESWNSSEDDSAVYYRGRHVNLQTGFRGILPRMMWKRALKDNEKSAPTRLNRPKREGKGVAKRKVNNNGSILANPSAGDSFFIADDQVDGESEIMRENLYRDEHDSEYMQSIGNYLEDKFGDLYAFDDLSDDEKLPEEEADMIFTPEHLQPASMQQHVPQSGVPSFSPEVSDSDLKIIEERKSSRKGADDIIDAMLTARRHGSQPPVSRKQTAPPSHNSRRAFAAKVHTKAKRSKTNVNGVLSRGDTRSRKSAGSIKTRSLRRSHLKANYENSFRLSTKVQSHVDNMGQEGNAANAGLKKNAQGMESVKSYVFSSTKVKQPIFDTAVEEEGNRFAIIKKTGKNDRDTTTEANFVDNTEASSKVQFPLMSLVCGNKPAGPQTIDFTLSGKPYRISTYDTNLASTLEVVFNHIVEKGASDLEIYSMNNLIVPLLGQLNVPGLWVVVDNFHQLFRSKANLLRNRVKPVHFYQIAACQVMLNEIRCYSSTSKLLSADITNKILDHTVSFFKLISKSDLSDLNDSLLEKSYALMASLIKGMVKGPELWERIRSLSFPSKVALIILRQFPHEETCWQIAEIGTSYVEANDWLQFIYYSISYCSWNIDGALIQKFYNFFKSRKFQNFPEENSFETKLGIVGTPTWSRSPKTVFNVFIDLVEACPLSPVQMERITPIGQIISLTSRSLLANRINLLLVLAGHADSSFEQKFEDLCHPYIEASDPKVLGLEEAYGLILTGFCCLLQTNARKTFITKARIASLAVQQVVKYRGLSVFRTLSEFLKQIYSVAPFLEKSMPFVLKSLYPALMFMIKVKEKVELVPLLKFFGKHLHLLDVTWVMTHLHQGFSDLADDDDHLFQFYFVITKLLASKKAITWWSVLNYNNVLSASKKHYVRFCTLVVEHCDEYSFLQIRHKLLQTVVDSLFEPVDYALTKFLKALSRRDNEFEVHSNLSYLAGNVEVATGALNAFKKVKDHSFIESLVTKLKEELLTRPISKPLVMELTKILNREYVDILKSNPAFLYLKSQFNISDTETEKSIFREVLSSQKGELERAIFLEDELLKIASQGLSLSQFLEKLESSMGADIYLNEYLFFYQLIEINASTEEESRTEIQWFVLSTLVRFVNKHLEKAHNQINSADFAALYQLHSYICSTHRSSHAESFKGFYEGEFYYEISLFLIRNLFISSGFIEYETLTAKCRSFLGNSAPSAHRLSTGTSAYPVRKLLQKYGPSIHPNFQKTSEFPNLHEATRRCFTTLSALLS
ncbi:Mms22p LALA0_S04e00320g [Lachancea lanzarotensis]|uniref:LALA0S04e00320g1_1 n=1 Tax=Lachancea lanzarotensis TaxID=1245769 RepID=A0A0C7N578_9SACH|nr:uncharacterized protein LALA0_S04e00320g [Lachancea lanzarotensis]CEP61773.1 LALA0S04e00320g1_1 [Lachancea lanzarotensis]